MKLHKIREGSRFRATESIFDKLPEKKMMKTKLPNSTFSKSRGYLLLIRGALINYMVYTFMFSFCSSQPQAGPAVLNYFVKEGHRNR